MSRAARHDRFGGLDVLKVEEVTEPHAGAGELRIHVTAAGLNPVDWQIMSDPEKATRFGVALPAGFGSDFAGVVDEVGPGSGRFAVGDRVFGSAAGRAVADFVVVQASAPTLWPTPPGIRDDLASALPVAGLTAVAALAAVDLQADDTVLIGGAAGGVGIFAVQLARLTGARVLGTASESTFDFLRGLGAEPVAYGPGLEERVRSAAPDGITAAVDLHGRDVAEAAIALGVAPQRVSTIADGPDRPEGARRTGGFHAPPGAMEQVLDAIGSGRIRIPIAAEFPLDRLGEAVSMQASGHAHGKVLVTL